MVFGLETVFTYTVLLLNITYAGLALGLLSKKPEILDKIDYSVNVFISVFLVWRFNPLFPAKFTEFDRKVVFSAGTFLFTVTVVDIFLKTYVDEAKKYAKKGVAEIGDQTFQTAQNLYDISSSVKVE
jgi:hypothetical protein